MMVAAELYEVTWSKSTKNRYMKLGYEYTNMGDTFLAKVEDISYGSSIKIKVECDNCKIVYETFMYSYSRSIRRTGKSYCYACGNKHFLKDVEEVKKVFIDRGYTPLFTEYSNPNQKLEYVCNKHPDTVQTSKYLAIKRGRMGGCRFCGRENAVAKNIGPLNVSWRGGITPKNDAARKTKDMVEWKLRVLQRDNYTCVRCGVRGGRINVHHILSFSEFEDLRCELSNGATLCVECHTSTKFNSFHHVYGIKNYTIENFIEFLATTKSKESMCG